MTSERHQKTIMFGDQGFFERGHNVSFSRSREANLTERLDGMVSIPQEWHKKRVKLDLIISKASKLLNLKEDLMIYYKQFSLPQQTTMPGTLENIKNRFHHHKVLRILKGIIRLQY